VAAIRSLTTGTLPLLAEAGPRRRRAATTAMAILVPWMAAHMASTTFGIGARSHAVDVVVNLWGQQVIVAAAFALVALRASGAGNGRGAWIALAVALGVWGAGNSYWTVASS
jgi:hypothetical protein